MNYRCETDPERIKDYVQNAAVLAFDFETSPLIQYRDDPRASLDAHRACIVGVSLSVAEASAIYIPLEHMEGGNAEPDDVIPLLAELVWTNPGVVKIAHNLAFESMFLYALGIIVQPPCYDTIAAAQLTLKEPFVFRSLSDCGLKRLVPELLGDELPTFEDVTAGRYFDELSPGDPETVRYACADSDYALRLYLMNAPFKISDECCNEMKKKPMKRYAHETGHVPIIGTMAEESKLRTQHWLQEGCNAYDAKRPTSKPMSFWTEADVWQYIRENNIPYSKIYDMGYGRTGCIFCMFGAHFDGQPTRFQRLQRTHPKLWRYCMKDWEAGGLGMRQVLEYMGIPFENYIGEINGNTENSGCPLESCGLQSPCRSQAGRQGIRETETVNQ